MENSEQTYSKEEIKAMIKEERAGRGSKAFCPWCGKKHDDRERFPIVRADTKLHDHCQIESDLYFDQLFQRNRYRPNTFTSALH